MNNAKHLKSLKYTMENKRIRLSERDLQIFANFDVYTKERRISICRQFNDTYNYSQNLLVVISRKNILQAWKYVDNRLHLRRTLKVIIKLLKRKALSTYHF